MPASGARERFFGSVFKSCENVGRPIYASRLRRPHIGHTKPALPEPCRATVCPVLWGCPRPPSQPGTSVPIGSQDQGSQLPVAGKPLWGQGMSSVQFPKTGPGLVLPGAKNCELRVGMVYPLPPQGDLVSQSQPQTGKDYKFHQPLEPRLPRVREPWISGGLGARWSAKPTFHAAYSTTEAGMVQPLSATWPETPPSLGRPSLPWPCGGRSSCFPQARAGAGALPLGSLSSALCPLSQPLRSEGKRAEAAER